MILEILSKNYATSEKLKDIIAKKVNKLDKFFEGDTKVKVTLKQVKEVYTLELNIAMDNGVLRAEVSSDNMYNNIDLALPKLEKQIIRHHERVASKSKKFRQKMIVEQSVAEEKSGAVVRKKLYKLTPMSVEDAIEELELVGHSFYVFFNKTENNVNVVYRRNDGDYGLISTEV